ncbi:hypothetical protein TNCV_2485221 [Trichonephila clavipes]|uniref:Uncharacterized protein n=1 Tax=Trichonephila clavipes TaxID=2585209 RepID=A0A8X6VZE9_TRICX|nr:hypothetical protein TNCV_2485221 [Trichonephila clavipes]
MKEGLIALNYECSKCNERMGLYERKSAVLDGDFEWVCSTITSQNIYGRTPMILLTMRPSRLFVKIRCHAVASTRKRSAVRNSTSGIQQQVYVTRAVRSCSLIGHSTGNNGRRIVGCIETNPMCWRWQRKQRRSVLLYLPLQLSEFHTQVAPEEEI